MHTLMHVLLHANPLLIYCVVALALLLESTGIPIINNTLLLFAGAWASLGHANIWALAFAAIGGSIAGACIAYFLGRYKGRRAMFFLAGLCHVDVQKVYIVERWFRTAGIWMVFLSRMIPYVRPFACFPAGMACTNFLRFFLSALAGSTIWCSVMLCIGWHLGRRWDMAVQMMRADMFPLLVGAVILIAMCLLVMYAIKRRLQAQLQASTSVSHDEEGQSCCELAEMKR